MSAVDDRRGLLASVDSTPSGLYTVRQTSSDQSYGYLYEGVDALSSHGKGPNSLHDSEANDAFEEWTELGNLSFTRGQDSDAKNLIEHRIRRGSSASSSSSTSSIIHQTWAVRCAESIGIAVARFSTLPIIRDVLWPFYWCGNAIGRASRRPRFQGWRMGLLLGCTASSIVLCINIAVLIFIAKRGYGFTDGFAVPLTGSAEDMSRYNRAIHIGINVLSTILLAASNYTMQVLSSPTRKDIDKAHAKNGYLDIGILSTRNLSHIPRRRLLLFLIMAFSSVPIHLFYNSALFYIGASNEYDIITVEVGSDEYRNEYAAKPQTYETIIGSRWRSMYHTSLVSYGTLILAVEEYRSEINDTTQDGKPPNWPDVDGDTTAAWNAGAMSWKLPSPLKSEHNTNFSNLEIITNTGSVSRDWVRMDRILSIMSTGANATNKVPVTDSTPKFAYVPHVFVQSVGARPSRIQASLTFLVIVIVCNFVKLLTMLWVVSKEHKDYVVTLGDGVASFLEYRDLTTQRMCMLSKKEITLGLRLASLKHDDRPEELAMKSGTTWAKKNIRYSQARSRDMNVGTYLIFLVNIVLFVFFIVIIGHAIGVAKNEKDQSPLSMKWGSASAITFRETDTSPQQTLLNAWIANAPQLILSFLYLAINSESTAIAGIDEWNSLASSHKGLRVTKPVGRQRDTYFLQLPYRWALPLMVASSGLHWLLSQSIFLVRIDTYDRDGNLFMDDRSRSACGFSGPSWLTLTGCFWIITGAVILKSRKRIRMKLPFAASCSLVISAACHAPSSDEDAQLKPLRWGVVEERMYDGELHCSLSSKAVTRPKAGATYL